MPADEFGNYIPGLTDDTGYVTPQSGTGIGSGAGAPDGSTPISLIYINTDNGDIYTNPSGVAGAWILVGGSSGGGLVIQTGSGSPVGVKTPAYIGQLYSDYTTPGLWGATGLTSADWTIQYI